jgi:hypothetical protein
MNCRNDSPVPRKLPGHGTADSDAVPITMVTRPSSFMLIFLGMYSAARVSLKRDPSW